LSNVGGSKSFIRLLKETSFAYFFGLGGIFAGFTLGSLILHLGHLLFTLSLLALKVLLVVFLVDD